MASFFSIFFSHVLLLNKFLYVYALRLCSCCSQFILSCYLAFWSFKRYSKHMGLNLARNLSYLRYYDTADMLIYSNSAGKPSMWPTGWVCPGLANLFEGGLKPNLLWSSFMVWTEEQTMIFSDQHQFWHEASSGI